jgi:hypothetical protein
VLHGAILTEYEDGNTGRKRRESCAKDAKKDKEKMQKAKKFSKAL